jgi:hypothetical protein
MISCRKRRARHYERIKKPPKNTFPGKKPGRTRPPNQVTYQIKVTRKAIPPAQTP